MQVPGTPLPNKFPPAILNEIFAYILKDEGQ